MKKKEYIAPEMNVVEIGNEVILAGSAPSEIDIGLGDGAIEITDDNRSNFEW